VDATGETIQLESVHQGYALAPARFWHDSRGLKVLGMGTELPGPPVSTADLLTRVEKRWSSPCRVANGLCRSTQDFNTTHLPRFRSAARAAPSGTFQSRSGSGGSDNRTEGSEAWSRRPRVSCRAYYRSGAPGTAQHRARRGSSGLFQTIHAPLQCRQRHLRCYHGNHCMRELLVIRKGFLG